MLKIYFNIAIRSLLKNRFFSVLNVMGLSVGIACVLMIYLYIHHELSYDQQIPHHERTYLVNTKGQLGGSDLHIPQTTAAMGPVLTNDYPFIESFTRFREKGAQIIRYGENSLKEEKAIFADSNYFEFWGGRLLEGDEQTALKNPQSVVLTEALADKIFGDEDAIGKYLTVAGKFEYKVTGIMEKMPENMHFNFEMIMSMSSLEEAKDLHWLNMNFFTYFRLAEGSPRAALKDQFPKAIEKYVGPEIDRFMGVSLEDFREGGNDIGFYLQPVADIHLKSEASGGFPGRGDIKYIYIFSAIGLFILTLACINFMNLSTARSANRAKEVGIKKVMGAMKPQLVGQFISESTLIAFTALIVGVIMVFFSFPFFNKVSGKSLDPSELYQPNVLLIMMLLVVIVGVVAGSYPAFFLSRFQPVKVLKGKIAMGAKSGYFRSILVTFQFAVSIFLIIGTLVVFKQLQYLQNKNLGFDKEQVILLENTYMLRGSINAFLDEVVKNTAFKAGTISSSSPSPASSEWITAFWSGRTKSNKNTSTMTFYQVDDQFVPVYGMEILEGRNFDKAMATDTAAVLLNEAAVRRFGFTNPIGQYVSHITDINTEGYTSYKVIGVVKDFHYDHLKTAISPLVIANKDTDARIAFRMNTNNYQEAINTLKATWDEFVPAQPFEYKFLDQELMTQYESEQKISDLFEIFTGLTIFVACLGLFGLASFTTEQRSKEIGIRKVLGASVQGIVFLISKDFMKLVVLSFLVAAPLAYFFMSSWLLDFEYRIALSIWIFLGSGAAALLIAWLTLSYQSIRSAIANPVNSLRSE